MIHPEVCKIILMLGICCNQVISQSHIDVFPGLESNELLEKIVEEFKPQNVLRYSQAKDILYSEIYNENDSVACVYSGHSLYLPSGVDPSIHLYMEASSDGINTEHTYPRSKGASEENGQPFSDLHHLFPTRLAVNVARSNFPFGEITDEQTTSWFYTNRTISNRPSDNIDAYSERINGMFEPREDHKGNVARAIFYFYTMYQEYALEADPDYFESQRTTLCEWHNLDPVDEKEWERTFQISKYQDNQPNPFVLDCSLVSRTFCQDYNFDCALRTSTEEIPKVTLKVFPSPVVSELNVISEGSHKVRVLDIFGRELVEVDFINSTVLNLESFRPGPYLIQVGNQVVKIVK